MNLSNTVSFNGRADRKLPSIHNLRMRLSRLAPELSVSDLATSSHFYRNVLGFELLFERPEEGFECLDYEGARLMLDQIGIGRDFTVGPLERPYGRGINFEIAVSDTELLLKPLKEAGIKPFLPIEEKTYRVGQTRVTQRQSCVQDPDGYLLRFAEIVQTL